jgi:NAD-dependent dihydropyrimidine dehydrogenase PreA subunit
VAEIDHQRHQIIIDEEKCIGCGVCIEYCNVEALAISEETGKVQVVDLESCIECHSCQQMCPEKAIMVYPQVKDVLKEI